MIDKYEKSTKFAITVGFKFKDNRYLLDLFTIHYPIKYNFYLFHKTRIEVD